jgi:hypothetical protein
MMRPGAAAHLPAIARLQALLLADHPLSSLTP